MVESFLPEGIGSPLDDVVGEVGDLERLKVAEVPVQGARGRKLAAAEAPQGQYGKERK